MQFQEMIDFLTTSFLILLILIIGGFVWRKKRPKRYTRIEKENPSMAEDSFSVAVSTSTVIHNQVVPDDRDYFHFDNAATCVAEFEELLARFAEGAGIHLTPQPFTSRGLEPIPKSVFAPCRICRSEEHRTYNCTLSVINRKELLHKQRRCLKCFGKGHLDPRECWARNSRNPFPVPSSRPNTGTAVPWTYHFCATQGGSPSDEEENYSIKSYFHSLARKEIVKCPGTRIFSRTSLWIPDGRGSQVQLGNCREQHGTAASDRQFRGFDSLGGTGRCLFGKSASTEEEEETDHEDEEDTEQLDSAGQSKPAEPEKSVGSSWEPKCW